MQIWRKRFLDLERGRFDLSEGVFSRRKPPNDGGEGGGNGGRRLPEVATVRERERASLSKLRQKKIKGKVEKSVLKGYI